MLQDLLHHFSVIALMVVTVWIICEFYYGDDEDIVFYVFFV